MKSLLEMYYVVVIPYTLISIIFLILIVLAISRFKMTLNQAHDRNVKIFYFLMIIFCIFRLITSIYVIDHSLEQDENCSNPIEEIYNNKFFFTMILFPDIVYWAIFLRMILQLHHLFYQCHLQYESINRLKSCSEIFFFIVKIFGLLVQLIFLVIFVIDFTKLELYLIQSSCFSYFFPFLLIILEISLHWKFSGLPYRSIFHEASKGTVNRTIVYWGFGRALHGTVAIVLLKKFPNVFAGGGGKAINGMVTDDQFNEFLIILGLILGDILFAEIFPLFLAFNMEFVRCFFRISDDGRASTGTLLYEDYNIGGVQNTSYKQRTSSTYSSGRDDPMRSNHSQWESFFQERDSINYSTLSIENPLIERFSSKDFAFQELLPVPSRTKRATFGLIRLGHVKFSHSDKHKRVALRELIIKKLSPFMMEELNRDLNKYVFLQQKFEGKIVKLMGFIEENDKYSFVLERPKNGSLCNFLKENKGKMQGDCPIISPDVKKRIALDLASTMTLLHELSPPVCHGHLNSNNILLDKNFSPKISDLLFEKLKKYSGIYSGYSQTGPYSAPEVLDPNVKTYQKKPVDVYSFGIILWEMFTETKPFKNIPKNELVKLVFENKSRPKVPETIEESWAQLIRLCWQQDPEKRPTFEQIVKLMENMEFSNDESGGL